MNKITVPVTKVCLFLAEVKHIGLCSAVTRHILFSKRK